MANCAPADNARINSLRPRQDRLIAKLQAGDCSVLPELNGLLAPTRAIFEDTQRRVANGNNPQRCIFGGWKILPTAGPCGCKDVNHLYACSGSTRTAAAKPPTEHSHAAPQQQSSTSANQQSGSCSDVTGLGGGGPPIKCSTQNGLPGLPGNKPVARTTVAPSLNEDGSPSDQEVVAAMDDILNGMNQLPTAAPATPVPAPQTAPTPPASAQPNPACKPFYSASPAKEAELYMIAGAAAEQYRTCADWSAAQGNYLNAAKYYACIGNDARRDIAQAKAYALGAAVDAVEAKNQCNQFAGQAPQPGGNDNPYRGACSLTADQLQEVLTYMTKVADVENEEYPSEIATAIKQKFGRGCPVPTLRTCLEASLHNQSAPGCRSPAKPSPGDNQ